MKIVGILAPCVILLLTACAPKPQEQAAQQQPSGATAATGSTAAPTTPPAGGAATPEATPPAAAAPRAGTPAPAAPRSAAPTKADAPPRVPERRVLTLPAGTDIRIRTGSTLSSKTAEPGETFSGTLAEALVVDGVTVARRGANVQGRVVEADQGGRVKGLASLAVTLSSIETTDGPVRIRTGNVTRQAKSSKKKDAAKVGIGAGIGAAIGAIAGGGKGAAIGAGTGAGAGTGVVLATKGEAAVIPVETILTFELAEPVTIK